MQVRGIETVMQWVDDLDASQRWYAEFLGVEPTTPHHDEPYFKFGERAYLILGQASPGTGRGGTGVWFEVTSVDDAYRDLAAQGYKFNEEPFDVPPGRLVTINDPDGNIVGLIDNSKDGMPGPE